MTYTPYSKSNAHFSDMAHDFATRILYPKIFSTDDLIFEDISDWKTDEDKIMDGQMGIDKIVRVSVNGLKDRLKFTFQERFRKKDYANYRDLTITEWNHNSKLPSELYKITAGLFLYGYFDTEKLDFTEAIVIETSGLLYQIAIGQLNFRSGMNHRSNQSFITLEFDNLINQGLVIYHYSPFNNNQQLQLSI